MPKLYELTDAYQHILDLVEAEEEGDTSSWQAALEDLDEAIEDKMENIGRLFKNMEMLATACLAESERLRNRGRRLQGQMEFLKLYVMKNLRALNKRHMDARNFSFHISKNPPGIAVVDPEKIPQKYWRASLTVSAELLPANLLEQSKLEPDKKLIKEDLGDGVEVPGVDQYQGERLDIR